MARVIKAGDGAPQRQARPATRVLAGGETKKIIEKEMIAAREQAQALLQDAEVERKEIVAEGKRDAALAHEVAMARGASEAFAEAAAQALVAFRARAQRYDDAADDIRLLALELVKKITGGEPDLARSDVDRTVKKGLSALRAKRRLRVQVASGRRHELAFERSNLLKAVDGQPDLLIEEVADVPEGFARVVTEIGGALCAEEAALMALADAVGVREQKRDRSLSSTQGPSLGASPPTTSPSMRGSRSMGPTTDPALPVPSLPASLRSPMRANTSMHRLDAMDDEMEALPDAAVISVEDDAQDDDDDATHVQMQRVVVSPAPTGLGLFTDDALQRSPPKRR
jgi:flagellar biosynthesis/type III secretory pathway protein FliH